MYILSPIANTVLRNATGYFSFHYRRYFRTPSLSCPITLSGTPPYLICDEHRERWPSSYHLPLYFLPLRPEETAPIFCAAKHRGGRGGVTWPNNRQSVYNSSLNTIKKLLRTSHLHDSYRIHFLLSQKKFTFSLGITLDLRLILYSA